MSGDGGQILPQGPAGLCFEKDVFMTNDFDVDTFVLSCKKRVSLDVLRDDLSVYLKILQNALIELINKDYADFVNLSTNLVGMDKAIKNITVPLGQLKEEVLTVRSSLENAMIAMQDKLDYRKRLQDKKESLQRLVDIIMSVEKMERLLSNPGSATSADDPSGQQFNGKLIERVASEFNKLQFNVTKIGRHQLVEDIKPRIVLITTTLQENLEGSFLYGLESENKVILHQCLRTYALIGKANDAENLFAVHVLRPHLKKIITEHSIKSGIDGVKTMYNESLELIPKFCKILKEVMYVENSGEQIRGFDFLVNGLWPEVVNTVITQASSIFAPGNPSVFHQRYIESMKFVENFEKCLSTTENIKQLRAHPSYNLFMSKWSLPVYFQIRFQDIAGSFENSICEFRKDHVLEGSKDFKLPTSESLWLCLESCWKDEIYLPGLSHRFLKLTFQLVSRYLQWLGDIYSDENVEQTRPNGLDDLTTESSKSDRDKPSVKPLPISFTVALIYDLQTLSERLLDFCENTVLPKLSTAGIQNTQSIKDCFSDMSESLLVKVPMFHDHIAQDIIGQCSTYFKQVNDIPRLFRRTNREAPSKSSKYLTLLIEALSSQLEQYNQQMRESSLTCLKVAVLSSLSEQYVVLTNDVLTSVKKTEESLKRLKRARGGETTSAVGSLSDDDKIRLQIIIDVESFVSWINNQHEKLDLHSSVDRLQEVRSTAKSAMST